MGQSRRDFLKIAGAATIAAGVTREVFTSTAEAETKPSGALTKHVLPDLPYPYDALEPVIDRETMELHHSKHHQGYVNALNHAEEQLAKARTTGDFTMVQHWSRQIAFHGAGHRLHCIFWGTMAPTKQGDQNLPSGEFAAAIKRDFGSFDQFKKQFSAAAKSVEGSGWAMLALRNFDHRLVVLQVENHQKLSTWDVAPILVLDVWEHAYYVSYRNRRADYVDSWWQVVNWAAVAKRWKGFLQTQA